MRDVRGGSLVRRRESRPFTCRLVFAVGLRGDVAEPIEGSAVAQTAHGAQAAVEDPRQRLDRVFV